MEHKLRPKYIAEKLQEKVANANEAEKVRLLDNIVADAKDYGVNVQGLGHSEILWELAYALSDLGNEEIKEEWGIENTPYNNPQYEKLRNTLGIS